MLSVVAGVVLVVAASALLWYCKPRNGPQPWIVTIPGLDFLMPIVILIGLVIGVALIGAGTGVLT